jgi:DNA gyrase/topoisomerase IV subunit B
MLHRSASTLSSGYSLFFHGNHGGGRTAAAVLSRLWLPQHENVDHAPFDFATVQDRRFNQSQQLSFSFDRFQTIKCTAFPPSSTWRKRQLPHRIVQCCSTGYFNPSHMTYCVTPKQFSVVSPFILSHITQKVFQQQKFLCLSYDPSRSFHTTTSTNINEANIPSEHEIPRKRRGRPKKAAADTTLPQLQSSSLEVVSQQLTETVPRKPRGRPRKNASDAHPSSKPDAKQKKVRQVPGRSIPKASTSELTDTISQLNDSETFVIEMPIGEEPERSVEETYSRKTPLEHVLLRPGMYVGPNQRSQPMETYVLNTRIPNPSLNDDTVSLATVSITHSTPYARPMDVVDTLQHAQIIRRELGIVPALVKVFDEILVNASDNRLRHPKSCTRIDVIIDPGHEEAGRPPFISVWNNGKGIPIEIHAVEGMYVPEMLFGHLLTGSNFNDDEKRVTGGRHGYGAKLTNIFSKRFCVETVDSKKKLRYRQEWQDNMRVASAPVIEKLADTDQAFSQLLTKDYTCVSFIPDMSILTSEPNRVAMDEADYSMMCRRVLDIAGCAGGTLNVAVNGIDVSMASFADYVELFRPISNSAFNAIDLDTENSSDGITSVPPILYSKPNARWTVGIGASTSGSFEAVSFVNGIATTRGGTHIAAIVQQVTKFIQEKFEKIDPALSSSVTPSLIRRNLFVACNSLIENPSFDSQMKETLTTVPSHFGSSCLLTPKFLKSLIQSTDDGGPGIIEAIKQSVQGAHQAVLLKKVGGKKSKRQILAISKLDDAHSAGSDRSAECTLILTEGDSAKALAVAGLEVVGRDHFGVFPLRGKLLNVRDVAVSKLTGNEEVKALVAILGLDFSVEYSTIADRRKLRYGHVMLMTDQDSGTCVVLFQYICRILLLANCFYTCSISLPRWISH